MGRNREKIRGNREWEGDRRFPLNMLTCLRINTQVKLSEQLQAIKTVQATKICKFTECNCG